jgi:Cu(I)/Ag(I) efflux system membrane protein CusA/SilA
VLTLEAQEGRLFKPLAYTKTLAMIVAAILAITLDPALRLLLAGRDQFMFRPCWLCCAVNTLLAGRVHSERRHPVSRALIRIYEPVVAWSLRWKWPILAGAVALVITTIPVFLNIGSEFPPLDEGKLLQVTDRIIKQFPEVDHVLGKAGRAETATDPAPLSMLETVITLKPDSQWPRIRTWYSDWAPEWAKTVFRHLTPDHLSHSELVAQLDSALRLPGLSNSWTMPIKGRLDMLSTGMRTPVGLKVYGSDPKQIEAVGSRLASLLAAVPGARSVFSERSAGGYFLDIEWNRDALARYGLSIEAADTAIQNAIGGEVVTTTVEGRARYPVNVRYMRDFRSDLGALRRVLVAASDGRRQVAISELADIHPATGPAMIRDENGLLSGYVYIDLQDWDAASFIAEANRVLDRNQRLLPAGYSIEWSGEYEAIERVRERLKLVLPLTGLLICLLLYTNTGSAMRTLIILLGVPFSAVGAVWCVYLLGYNMSVGVWVGSTVLPGFAKPSSRVL